MPVLMKMLDDGFIYIPRPTSRVDANILINSVDYKSSLVKCNVKRFVTSASGSFELILNNTGGRYTNSIAFGDTVEITISYLGIDVELIKGKVYDIVPTGMPPMLKITGADLSREAQNRIVNKVYTNQTIAYIFKDLVSEYLTGYTTTNVAETNEMLNVISISWSGKPMFQCLEELMEKTENTHHFYCDSSSDWHVFRKGSIVNELEAVVFNSNMTSVEYTETVADVKNDITLYGSSIEGMPQFYTKNTGYGTLAPDMTQKNTNLTSLSEIQTVVEKMANIYSTTEKRGKMGARGLPTLVPGELIYIFAPHHGLDGRYVAYDVEHTIEPSGFRTSFAFQEEKKQIKDLGTVLFERVKTEQALSGMENPHDASYSIVWTFADTTYINTTRSVSMSVSNGYLVTSAATGTYISTAWTCPEMIKKGVLKASGDNLSACSFWISNDAGTTWESVTLDELHEFGGEGDTFAIKISVPSTSKIKAICFQVVV